MEIRSSVPNSGTDSTGNNTAIQIVQVHNPLTGKMIPKTPNPLNPQRPVLHKYTPEQVEVVYHRRSGTDEVVKTPKVPSEPLKTTSKRNRKKTKSASAPNSAIANKGYATNEDLNGQEVRKFPTSAISQEDGEEVSSVNLKNNHSEPLESIDNAESLIQNNNHGHGSFNFSESENESVGDLINTHGPESKTDTVSSALLAKVTELTEIIGKFSIEMSEMEKRLRKLESDNVEIVNENSNLRLQYANHIKINSLVAVEMKRLKNLVNNSEAAVNRENVNALLRRAQLGLKEGENDKCWKNKTSDIVQIGNSAGIITEVKENQGNGTS